MSIGHSCASRGSLASDDQAGDPTPERGSSAAPDEALEREVLQLRDAVLTRQMIGTVTGLLAGQIRCTPEQGWKVLVGLSQTTNIKLREVARILLDVYCGESSPDDDELVLLLTSKLPDGVSWSSVGGDVLPRHGST